MPGHTTFNRDFRPDNVNEGASISGNTKASPSKRRPGRPKGSTKAKQTATAVTADLQDDIIEVPEWTTPKLADLPEKPTDSSGKLSYRTCGAGHFEVPISLF